TATSSRRTTSKAATDERTPANDDSRAGSGQAPRRAPDGARAGGRGAADLPVRAQRRHAAGGGGMSGGGNRGLMKMLAVALAAFAFTFALVPLYRIACEKVFGVRLEKGPVAGVSESATAAERWVTVQFDGGVNSKLPWSFEPEQLTMRVQPGKQYEAMYF